MAYVWDGLLILILVVAILIGRKRGFAKMLVRVVGSVLALVVAFSLSDQIAGGIFDSFLAKGIKEGIVAQVPDLSPDSIEEGVSAALDKMPGYVTTLMKQQNIDTKTLASHVADSFRTTSDASPAETVAETIVTQAVRPLTVLLLRVICFLVLLILLMILVRVLARLVDRFFTLPVLRGVNRVLGAALGALQGVLLILVATALLQIVALSAAPDAPMGRDTLQQTHLVKVVVEHNPLASLAVQITEGIEGLSKG